MRKIVLILAIALVGSILVIAHLIDIDNPRFPQGTLLNEKNNEVQTQLFRLGENEVVTITIGTEHVALKILKVFSSTDNISGVSGGDPCKAYKVTTKDKTEEVGVVCRKIPFGKKWEHRPWREWFDSLS